MREHNGRAWLAYHAAFLPRQKRPIAFRKLLMKSPARRRQRNWQAMKADVERYTASLGGKIVKPKVD